MAIVASGIRGEAVGKRYDVPVVKTTAPSTWLLPAVSLCQRELVRFLRQKHRVLGALATPILFWVLLGAGMGGGFHAGGSPGGGSFIEYFFPGTVAMILLFTAVFSTISIIEDRREGFLQAVLVAPVPRVAIVLGKVLGGTLLATGQGVLFLLLGPLIHVHFALGSFLLCLAMMLIVSFGLTSLGFCIAWRMSSAQGFHAVMNLFLMPLWFLSGALFPADGARGGLQWIMRANPLAYGVEGIRRALYLADSPSQPLTPLVGCLLICGLSAAVLFALGTVICRSRVAADFQ